MNLYTLKTYPLGRGREVYRVIEISGDDSLERLCSVILSAFNFDDDHLYEYCMDNKMYSPYSISCEPDSQSEHPLADIKLDQLNLVKGQKFSLHYDFGDDWMFPITVQKITDSPYHHVPNVIKSKGKVRQYPDPDGWGWDWDEDEDEDEEDPVNNLE